MGGQDERSMDRQYEYASAGDPDHYGLLSHDAGKCIDPVVEKRIVIKIAECGFRIADWKSKILNLQYEIRRTGMGVWRWERF